MAVANSKLLRQYAMIDRKTKSLILAVLTWAKENNISEASLGWWSSYAWTNMAYCLSNFELATAISFERQTSKDIVSCRFRLCIVVKKFPFRTGSLAYRTAINLSNSFEKSLWSVSRRLTIILLALSRSFFFDIFRSNWGICIDRSTSDSLVNRSDDTYSSVGAEYIKKKWAG